MILMRNIFFCFSFKQYIYVSIQNLKTIASIETQQLQLLQEKQKEEEYINSDPNPKNKLEIDLRERGNKKTIRKLINFRSFEFHKVEFYKKDTKLKKKKKKKKIKRYK